MDLCALMSSMNFVVSIGIYKDSRLREKIKFEIDMCKIFKIQESLSSTIEMRSTQIARPPAD